MSATSLTPDLAYLRHAIVNLYFFGPPGAGDRGWVLIDAGMPGGAHYTRLAAERRFGPGARPAAIVLTHGHQDHVGSLASLAQAWDAEIYAHPLELPYLTGRSAYPPPDPTVGGGALALLSPVFSAGPFDFRPRIRPLPEDGRVPGMPGWRWIHTPGHTPGHISLFREADRTLVAGDAFVTTKQESLLAAITQRPEIHGPPAYFTPDWVSARRSVELLASIYPELGATGHGRPMRGAMLRAGLADLARRFESRAVPRRGRYVARPATAGAGGVISVPPRRHPGLAGAAAGLAAAGMAGALYWRRRR
jgi:glyoxylase-like metal-dependent hydrolase (beta-lactamase superfamily II)